ncbi:MAG: hypothetical protein O3C05_03240 [Proteobacteria bacterium]|nr:hypothetical protein [Pseudomonadota bacterium]
MSGQKVIIGQRKVEQTIREYIDDLAPYIEKTQEVNKLYNHLSTLKKNYTEAIDLNENIKVESIKNEILSFLDITENEEVKLGISGIVTAIQSFLGGAQKQGMRSNNKEEVKNAAQLIYEIDAKLESYEGAMSDTLKTIGGIVLERMEIQFQSSEDEERYTETMVDCAKEILKKVEQPGWGDLRAQSIAAKLKGNRSTVKNITIDTPRDTLLFTYDILIAAFEAIAKCASSIKNYSVEKVNRMIDAVRSMQSQGKEQSRG